MKRRSGELDCPNSIAPGKPMHERGRNPRRTIDPALAAGWGVVEEAAFAASIIARAASKAGTARQAGSPTTSSPSAITSCRWSRPRQLNKPLTEGIGTGKELRRQTGYSPYTYSSNGRGIYGIDMDTGKEGQVQQYPSPDAMWGR